MVLCTRNTSTEYIFLSATSVSEQIIIPIRHLGIVHGCPFTVPGRGDVKAARCIWDLGHPVRQFSARVSCDLVTSSIVRK